MVKEALILICSVLSLVAVAKAEVSAENCDELSQLILRKSDAVDETTKVNEGKLTKSQHQEVTELLKEACSPKFAQCGFSYCTNPDNNSQLGSVNPPEGPKSEVGQGVVISWVKDDMDCNDFLEQLRLRFQSQNLDEAKRVELNASLDLACGEKFKRCNFEACKGRAH